VRCDRLAVALTCRPLLLLLPQEFQKLVAVDVQEELLPVEVGRFVGEVFHLPSGDSIAEDSWNGPYTGLCL
jgi:hypothetical protein